MLKINSFTCREVCSSKKERGSYHVPIYEEHPSYYAMSDGTIFPKMFFMKVGESLHPIYEISYAIRNFELKQFSNFGVVYGEA